VCFYSRKIFGLFTHSCKTYLQLWVLKNSAKCRGGFKQKHPEIGVSESAEESGRGAFSGCDAIEIGIREFVYCSAQRSRESFRAFHLPSVNPRSNTQ